MADARETNAVKALQATANPSPLGLFGLAIVTLVASTQKLGITEGTVNIIPWAIFLGAAAQLLAGFMDYRLNNTFGATAFSGYGFFWLGVAMTWMMGNGIIAMNPAAVVDTSQLAFAFLGYLIFTLYMTLGAMGTSKVLFVIFFLIDILFLGLFVSTLGVGGVFWKYLAGCAEMGIAIFSFYGSAANLLNTHYGKTVLPVGKAFGPWAMK